MDNFNNTFIIAEIGVNHNGDVEIAKRLIESAKYAGANAVKFQSLTANGLLSEDVALAHVPGGSLKKFFGSVELSREDHFTLKAYCDKVEIEFISTPFDFGMVNLLDEVGVKRFKVASCDINNIPFIEYIASKNKPMIISTGTASYDEVSELYYFLIYKKIPKEHITFLHCVSNYPTKLEDVNLGRMIQFKNTITENIGFSDHTEGILTSLVAVLWGAKVIERHFTLDKNMNGPDHKLSSDPQEFKQLVDNIRNLKHLSIYPMSLSQDEIDIVPLIRRSIVASKDIKIGDVFSLDNLTFKRPGTGLKPSEVYKIIGKLAKCNIKENDQIDFNKIG